MDNIFLKNKSYNPKLGVKYTDTSQCNETLTNADIQNGAPAVCTTDDFILSNAHEPKLKKSVANIT